MKNRIWLSLPLAAALMVPAVAQQSNSNTDMNQNPPAASQSDQQNQAPATQTTEQGTAQTAQTEGARQPLSADRHEGFWGHLNPFARKKYVQKQMEPIRGRVNELDELTSANAKQIKDVDSRAQEGIRLASAKANEADQHAVDAGNRAQQANQTATQASTRLNTVETVVGSLDQYQPVTQADIRFRAGQLVLSKKAKEALDQMADSVKGQKGYIVEVHGFSAGKGQAAIQNSQQMAQSVVRYLVLNHDIPVYRIYTMGMGNAPVPASAEGAKPRRTTSGGRVEVSLMKNGVEQLAGTTAEASPTTGTQGGVSGTTAQPTTQQPSSSQQYNTQQPASNMGQTQQPQQQTPPPPQR